MNRVVFQTFFDVLEYFVYENKVTAAMFNMDEKSDTVLQRPEKKQQLRAKSIK
jgi:hypothetical protein